MKLNAIYYIFVFLATHCLALTTMANDGCQMSKEKKMEKARMLFIMGVWGGDIREPKIAFVPGDDNQIIGFVDLYEGNYPLESKVKIGRFAMLVHFDKHCNMNLKSEKTEVTGI